MRLADKNLMTNSRPPKDFAKTLSAIRYPPVWALGKRFIANRRNFQVLTGRQPSHRPGAGLNSL